VGVLLDDLAGSGGVTMSAPASEADLQHCSELLGHPLPPALAELLRESDGIVGEYGLSLLWPASRVAQDNYRFRTDVSFRDLYMSFDDLVFFADAGNGDQFAISTRGPRDVFVWNHGDDSRTWVATTPIDYLRRWVSGELKV
jgi:hypothetical protein